MKQAIIEKFGDVDVLKIVEKDQPKLKSGEVLVRVKYAGLNPKDVLIRKGKFKMMTGSKFPQSVGFDFAGEIEDPSQSHFKKGEKVYGMLNGWKGRTCAEYVNADLNEVFFMPKNISSEQAAGIPLAAQTALQAIRNIGQLKIGDQVLINGASGGVGTLAIQIAKALGGHVTTVSSSKNLEFCQSLGADESISYESTDLLSRQKKFDVFFDVFGNFSFQKVAPILKKKGKYVTTVPKPAIFKEQIKNPFRSKKARMVVVKSNQKDLQWLKDRIEEEKIRPVLDKIFALEETKEAQKYIESKRAKGKVIIRIG